MHMKLLNPEHLARGTERQKAAGKTLSDLEIFAKLKNYSPVLAGDIPLDVDIASSPILLFCYTENLEAFAQELVAGFGANEDLTVTHRIKGNFPAVHATFTNNNFAIEIVGQPLSVFQQPEVLLMLIEARLLAFAPADAKDRIRALKSAGEETAEAFGSCFLLEGSAREELLKIAHLTDRDILHVAHRFLFRPN